MKRRLLKARNDLAIKLVRKVSYRYVSIINLHVSIISLLPIVNSRIFHKLPTNQTLSKQGNQAKSKKPSLSIIQNQTKIHH